ncbi:MAG: V-type ATP synthase subunit D [Oscillospiraceae bacterium]|nr:V-type ATP synthase subunit D [Oscillospiraceae bacterium]MDD3832846.1 V-type ATP synthase subunit D [Oscillospiraceae bacterium]MDD4546662.1 V-type ATP synthase subunit D [Oscillospiraceae bacterium]
MAQQIFPTKGNLINTKKSLELANVGFELLDRKRNIIIREMMTLIDRAAHVQEQIDDCYEQAYLALQRANIAHGVVSDIAAAVPEENGLSLTSRSVMGIEIPIVRLETQPLELSYGFMFSSALLDEAYIKFDSVKKLTAQLAEIENSVYRLATAVNKTQKRANALKNIIIPRLSSTVKTITDSLEEKEREDFSRLKVIKAQNQKK